jgi:segregation and condensation protein B
VESSTQNLEESPQEEANSELPLAARLSAAMLAHGKPVSLQALAKATGEDEEIVEGALLNLASLFQDETHGFSVQQVQGGFQFRTAMGARDLIENLLPPRVKKFSKAAAETLAVVAYKQPIQRAEIEAIRGVDALPTLKTLIEAKVIRAIGRDDEIGKPVLYATTETFLERFGLNDLSELPSGVLRREERPRS